MAYELWVGPIPAGFTVDHVCHNGSGCTAGRDCLHRRCINPAHLEAVTYRVNAHRGNGLAAANAAKTHCDHGHELAPENLYTSNGWRECKACNKIRGAARYGHRVAA